MELKLDVKTLVIGIALGVIITAVTGAGSADKTDFGIAVAEKGAAVVRTPKGALYIVNASNGMATRVLHAGARDNPDDRRSNKGSPFFLSSSGE
jgi:hypothetical protein